MIAKVLRRPYRDCRKHLPAIPEGRVAGRELLVEITNQRFSMPTRSQLFQKPFGDGRWMSNRHDGPLQVLLRRPSIFAYIDQMRKRDYLGQFELMVLLAILQAGEDAYGVPIARQIEETTGKEVALGSIYAALERLEEKGLVTSSMGDPTPERGGRAKRYFRVT